MIPTTAKAEWHITYRCSLRCAACSRASFLNPPHTEDMTLDDAREWCRQADEVGWKNFQPEKEKARIILIGGEPTLHPLYMDFVRLAREWSGTYPQTFTNAYTPRSREIVWIMLLNRSARAVGNLTGNCVATVVVAAWEGDLDREKAAKVLDGGELVDVTAG